MHKTNRLGVSVQPEVGSGDDFWDTGTFVEKTVKIEKNGDFWIEMKDILHTRVSLIADKQMNKTDYFGHIYTYLGHI